MVNKALNLACIYFPLLIADIRYLYIYNRFCEEFIYRSENGLSNNLYWEVAENIDLELVGATRLWEGVTKRKFFNYFLLRSDVLCKIKTEHQKARLAGSCLSKIPTLQDIKGVVLYIGKGQADRPLDHLKEALNYDKENEKIFETNQIWDAGHGVIVYKCFQNSTSYEAATREAIMIDFFGKEDLTNKRRGSYYGNIEHWPKEKLFNMGSFYISKIVFDLILNRHVAFLRDDVM